jgi:hypothetical protein
MTSRVVHWWGRLNWHRHRTLCGAFATARHENNTEIIGEVTCRRCQVQLRRRIKMLYAEAYDLGVDVICSPDRTLLSERDIDDIELEVYLG